MEISMSNQNHQQQRLASLLNELAVHEGLQPTRVEGVQVYRSSESAPRAPMVYQPHIIIVGQGQKRAFLGGKTYVYDPFNYLVLTVPLPAECEADATPDKPILMVNIDVGATMVSEMIAEMEDTADRPHPAVETPRGISTTPLSDDLGTAVIRLVECLRSNTDSRVLGRQMVREVVYRVLCGEQGGALRALANRDDHFTRISRLLRFIHTDFAKPLGTEEMAKRAGMSVSVFHHHFKLVTASSPLQYLKRIRLDRARMLMLHDGYNASTAAHAVGYESPSQFSREFKRLFGATPGEEAVHSRVRVATR
jgi:AraC-like DNA-binding protein